VETVGKLLIEGEVQGEVHGSAVVIGKKGRITGTIVAEEIVVSGLVLGSIRGKPIVLQSSSRVEGDVS
jgi:cytoskeletal protein CcmA (bactofilin family)